MQGPRYPLCLPRLLKLPPFAAGPEQERLRGTWLHQGLRRKGGLEQKAIQQFAGRPDAAAETRLPGALAAARAGSWKASAAASHCVTP